MSPEHFGWGDFFARQLSSEELEQNQFGRIIRVYRNKALILTPVAEQTAFLSPGDKPVVGDWVRWIALDGECHVRGVLSRRTTLCRAASGGGANQQIVAANIDLILIVMGLDGDFNLRRLERMLVMAWESGARPVIVLSKADLSADTDRQLAEVSTVAHGVNIHLCSSVDQMGLTAIAQEFAAGDTAALIGSSGVGKSTLVNDLCGRPVMQTGAVRASDSKGRHTTTHREMIVLPSQGVIIDNPGIREVQPWDTDRGLDETFADVIALAQTCRFRDCEHSGEPGCAVADAVASGHLDAGRLAGYQRIRADSRSLAIRRDEVQRRAQDRRTGKLYKSIQAEKRGRRG